MKFKAEIDIMPLEALLDPQGKAVTANLSNLGMDDIDHVRIGKHITLEVTAENTASAEKKVDNACKKILVNEIIESYCFKLEEIG